MYGSHISKPRINAPVLTRHYWIYNIFIRQVFIKVKFNLHLKIIFSKSLELEGIKFYETKTT